MPNSQLTIDFTIRLDPPTLQFNGPEFDRKRDGERLTGQYQAIFQLMQDAKWRSLKEIAGITGYPEASVSAQLRHMRKPRFGSHTVERQHVERGLFLYRVLANTEGVT